MESTYGDRRHRGREDTERELGAILAQAARDGGNVIVPAFAIGRSQELLYLLAKHYGEWHLARWKIFLDSPMAIAASKVYWRHPERFDEEATRLRDGLSRDAAAAQPGAVRNRGRIARHQQHARRRDHHRRQRHGQRRSRPASPQTQSARGPSATCSSSASRRRARSAGSSSIAARGAHPRPARAGARRRSTRSAGLSAHGDQADLLRWYDSFTPRPPVYLVHGEVPSAEALAVKLRERGATATVTRPGLKIDLASLARAGPRLTHPLESPANEHDRSGATAPA